MHTELQLGELREMASQMLVLSTVELTTAEAQLLESAYQRLYQGNIDPLQVRMVGERFRRWL